MNSFWLKVVWIALGLSAFFAATGGGATAVAKFEERHLLSAIYVQPIVLLGLFLQGIRHAIFVDRVSVTYVTATKAVVLAQGLNLLIPARLSEFLKATYLRDKAQIPVSTGLSVLLLERTVDLIIVGALGLFCLLKFAAMVNQVLVIALAMIVLIILIVALWGGRGIHAIVRYFPWLQVREFIVRVHSHFAVTLRQPRFFVGLTLGVLVWSVSYANIAILLSIAGEPPVGLYAALLIFICTTIGGAIPALPGGVGAYEAAAIVVLMSLGYSFHDALALAITLHAAQLALPLILALFLLMNERVGLAILIADVRKLVNETRSHR